MLRDITLGQYYPADSVIHKLDPRVKLSATVLFIAVLFACTSVSAYLLTTLCLATVIKVSKVPFKLIMKSLRGIFVLMLITVLFNLLLTPGTVIVRIWKLTITQEGVKTAVLMGIRLIYLVMGSSLMTFTTKPTDLTDGMEKGLRVLKKVHVPVHEIAMMMSIALRFIPILMEETDKIMKAQQARCADFESGGIMKRAKSMIPILVPLFVSAFRRANDLAMAMEARGYHGGEGRTKMYPLVYQKRDHLAYLLLLAYIVCMILVSRLFPMHIWIF